MTARNSLADLLKQTRTTPAALANLAHVHPSTARRWIASNRAPAAVLALIETQHTGKLPTSHPDWHGWSIHGKWLTDPQGLCFEAREIQARWLVWQMLKEAQPRSPNRPPVQLRLF